MLDLNKNRIKYYYKRFSYLNLIFSILFIFFAWKIDILERVFAFIAINAGYHMYYWFFKSTSNIMVATNNRFGISFERFGNKFFSIFGMVAGFLIAVSFISESISLGEYYRLFAICIPIGLFLGAYSSWVKMKEIDEV